MKKPWVCRWWILKWSDVLEVSVDAASGHDATRQRRRTLSHEHHSFSMACRLRHPLLTAAPLSHRSLRPRLCENSLLGLDRERTTRQNGDGCVFSTSPRVRRPPKLLCELVFTQPRP